MPKINILQLDDLTAMESLQMSAESMSSLVNQVGEYAGMVKDKFLSALSTTCANFASVNSNLEVSNFTALTADQKKFFKNTAELDYFQMRNLRAFQPEQFTGSFVEYVDTLKDCVTHLQGIPAMVQDYTGYLGRIISGTNEHLSTKLNDHSHIVAQYEKLTNELARFYTPKVQGVETTVERVISRNGDWKHVIDTLAHVETQLLHINRDKIRSHSKECTDFLEIIYQKTKAGELDAVTPEVSANVARGAYEIGRQLELFAIVYYRVLSFRKCVDQTMNFINEVLEN